MEICVKCGDVVIVEDIKIPIQRYPLNVVAVDRFISIVREKLGDWAANAYQLYLDNVVHVSFDFFIATLLRCVRRFENAINGKDFVLYLPQSPGQSTLWVTGLVYHLLSRKPQKIVRSLEAFDITNEITDYSYTESATPSVLFCDDASYSGSQLHNTLQRVRYPFVHVVLPFVTLGALQSIMTAPQYDTFGLVDIEYSLSIHHGYVMPQMDIILSPNYSKRDAERIFGENDKAAFYFDHKLADNWSVLSHVLALGKIGHYDKQKPGIDSVFNLNIDTGSLIEGCATDDNNFTGTLCPLPPYRKNAPHKTMKAQKLSEFAAERVEAEPKSTKHAMLYTPQSTIVHFRPSSLVVPSELSNMFRVKFTIEGRNNILSNSVFGIFHRPTAGDDDVILPQDAA